MLKNCSLLSLALLLLSSCGSYPAARQRPMAGSAVPETARGVTLREVMDYLPGVAPGYISL